VILSEKAEKDKLTGLPNRYYMSSYLQKLEKESELESFWVAMIDIDDFKVINDTYGHNFGDYVLETIAGIISTAEEDTKYCRWGGEEFILVGKIDDGMKRQHARLEELRRMIEEKTFTYEGKSVNLTMTIGMAAYEKGQTIDEWISMADKKMYLGKHSGKNQVVS
jgi:diguanylate cyclase (GGDEF)-like protein